MSERDAPESTLWRVFPFDPDASAGDPFSVDMVPARQGSGRFDVPDLTPVWYFGESAVHAIAESLQAFRGQTITNVDLTRASHRLAVVSATLPASVATQLVDLCDPDELAKRHIRPDHLASRDPATTQRIARSIHGDGATGFRWWSSIHGDWHATILFHAALQNGTLRFDTPSFLSTQDVHVAAACRALGVDIRRTRSRR